MQRVGEGCAHCDHAAPQCCARVRIVSEELDQPHGALAVIVYKLDTHPARIAGKARVRVTLVNVVAAIACREVAWYSGRTRLVPVDVLPWPPPDALRFAAEYLVHESTTTEHAYAGKSLRAALPLSWLCLPSGVAPRRFDAEVGRTRFRRRELGVVHGVNSAWCTA